jgi:hypothetical protein
MESNLLGVRRCLETLEGLEVRCYFLRPGRQASGARSIYTILINTTKAVKVSAVAGMMLRALLGTY